VKDNRRPHSRSRRDQTLHLAQNRLPARAVTPEICRSSFWQLRLRVIPIIAALVSNALLAYFVLDAQLSQLHAQLAQNQTPPPASQQPKPRAQASNPPQLVVPSDDALRILIRATLLALNQANVTGNYTVFREMAAPAFQQTNNPARLAEIFADLRHRNVDLSPILLLEPKLIRQPEVNASGLLQITGFFPTAPEQVNFDLIFAPVGGRWRLFGISANTSTPSARAEPEAAPADSAKATTPTKPAASHQAAKPSAPGPKATSKSTAPAEAGNAGSEQSLTPDIRDRIDLDR
jgi:hypothetical protein